MEKKLSSKQVFKGKLLNVFSDEVELEDGVQSTREYVTHPGGVCILGLIDNKVVMEKQFRYPYQEELLELPAGKLEQGENPIAAAKREFEEETGYKINNLISLGKLYPTLAYTNEVIHLFVATSLTKGEKHFDFDERLDVILMSLDEVVTKIKNNDIKDAKTIVAIYRYLFENKIKY